MRCIVVEDQPPARRILEKYIGDIRTLELVGTFDDPLKARDFLKNEKVDLLFLDIHLPKISGIELLRMISPDCQVILTTAFSEYALEGYDLQVADYLLKPFSFQRFVQAVERAERLQGESTRKSDETSDEFLFVKSGYERIRIEWNDIAFIRADKDYTHIVLENKKHLVSHTLKYWVSKLPSDRFCQVHKSYLVNIAKVEKVTGNQISIHGNTIPIGRVFKEAFTKRFLQD